MSNTSLVASGLRLRMQQGITWNIVNAFFTQGSVFVSNVIIANLLGKHIYGEFGMVQSTVLTIASIAQVATGITATKYVAEFRSTEREKAGRILGLCSVVAMIMAIVAALSLVMGAQWLSNNMLKAPHLAHGLMIVSGFVLFSAINGYQTGALAGLEGYRSLAQAGIIQGVVHLAVCTFAAWYYGLEGVLGGLTVSAFLRWYIYKKALYYESRKHSIKITYNNYWRERRIIYRFAVPAAVSGLTSMPALWLANTILVQQKNGYSEMGLYSAANTLRAMVLFLPTLINGVAMSLMNNQRGMGKNREYSRLFWYNFSVVLVIAIAGAALASMFGNILLSMFGSDFAIGDHMLVVFMFSTVPESIAISSAQIILSRGKMWLSLFLIAVPRDICIVLLAIVFVPQYGASGLMWSYSIAWLLTAIIVIYIVKKMGIDIKDAISSEQIGSV
jgi:O-antigen/teichoic acid export membrane protein